jgi:hypothetical protein
MSTPTVTQLRSEAEALLRFEGLSPVIQILAVALGQANNGTQPDPDLTTDQYLEQIKTWRNQANSDVTSIIVNQLMRTLKRVTKLEAQSAPITQVLEIADSYSFTVTVTGAKKGDYVDVAITEPASQIGGEWTAYGIVTNTNQVTVTLRAFGPLLACNFTASVFNVKVTPSDVA